MLIRTFPIGGTHHRSDRRVVQAQVPQGRTAETGGSSSRYTKQIMQAMRLSSAIRCRICSVRSATSRACIVMPSSKR